MAGFKQEARMEQWYFYHSTVYGKVLCGKVYGHPNPVFMDGDDVTTTAIIRENLDRNVVETKNTIYLLGRKKE
jgi:hypothetical protein